VEILCMTGAKPVENLTTKYFSGRDANDLSPSRCGRALRVAFRLIAPQRSVESSLFPRSGYPNVTVHRFEETIGGRAYHIEVTPVSNRWRAQLRRGPGIPTAMMPFYGQTPDEAAQQLTQWLVLAHQRFAATATVRPTTV
jgi:hypothetical protein